MQSFQNTLVPSTSICCLGTKYESICDPLCEIQAKVSKYNYEITSIKV